MTLSMIFLISALIAAASWLFGAYSIYKGLQALPAHLPDVPFFSKDPKHITTELIKWRNRVYASMANFSLSLTITLILHHAR